MAGQGRAALLCGCGARQRLPAELVRDKLRRASVRPRLRGAQQRRVSEPSPVVKIKLAAPSRPAFSLPLVAARSAFSPPFSLVRCVVRDLARLFPRDARARDPVPGGHQRGVPAPLVVSGGVAL